VAHGRFPRHLSPPAATTFTTNSTPLSIIIALPPPPPPSPNAQRKARFYGKHKYGQKRKVFFVPFLVGSVAPPTHLPQKKQNKRRRRRRLVVLGGIAVVPQYVSLLAMLLMNWSLALAKAWEMVISAKGTCPPVTPLMRTRLTMAWLSVSKMVPPSTSSSMVNMANSRLSKMVRRST